MFAHKVLFGEYVTLFARIDLQNPLCAKLTPAGMADSGKSSYSRSTVGTPCRTSSTFNVCVLPLQSRVKIIY